MKHLSSYICSLALLLPTTSFSGEVIQTELYCDQTATIISFLRKEHRESPILFGKASDMGDSTMSLWVNKKTKSWTILATKDKITCIVGWGEEFKTISNAEKYL